MKRTVQVTAKCDPILVDLAVRFEREDLVAARIGQDRTLPAHETVQPAQFGDEFVARAQVEVVGIRQHQGGAQFAQLGRCDALDRALRADRGEDGCEDVAVGCMQDAGARLAVGGEDFEGDGRGHDEGIITYPR